MPCRVKNERNPHCHRMTPSQNFQQLWKCSYTMIPNGMGYPKLIFTSSFSIQVARKSGKYKKISRIFFVMTEIGKCAIAPFLVGIIEQTFFCFIDYCHGSYVPDCHFPGIFQYPRIYHQIWIFGAKIWFYQLTSIFLENFLLFIFWFYSTK